MLAESAEWRVHYEPYHVREGGLYKNGKHYPAGTELRLVRQEQGVHGYRQIWEVVGSPDRTFETKFGDPDDLQIE